MVHKVVKSPRAELKMQVKSDLQLNPLLGHHVTEFISIEVQTVQEPKTNCGASGLPVDPGHAGCAALHLYWNV